MIALSKFAFIPVAAAGMCGFSAAAQQPARGNGADLNNMPAGEIIVTARRREESLQSVPLSIQAFDGKTLEERQITRLSDLTQVVPGLTAQASPFGNAALTLAIRGQRQGLANIAYDPAVSVYADEVVQARSQGLNDAFFDLASVQVLKGPQGTLFGRNTTGGAILLSSRAPTDHFEGYGEFTAGTYNLFRLEGAVNIPLAPGLALRVAGVGTRRDGYLRNYVQNRRIDDQKTESWRISLGYSPEGSAFENRLVVSGFHEKDDGVAYKLVNLNPAASAAPGLTPDFAFYQTAPFFTTNTGAPSDGTKIKTINLSNITTLDLGGVQLKNILGYRHVDSSIFFDLDGTSYLAAQSIQETREHQWSNETQLLGNLFDKQVNFVLGGYFFREKGDEAQSTIILDPASGTNLITDYTIISKTAAIYGQATYRPAAMPDLSLTGGLRYTWDSKQIDSRSRLFNGTCRLLTADVGGVARNPCFYSTDQDFSKLTYTASIDYKFAPGSLAYLTRRFGYQAGGFTNSATRPADFIPFKPQTVSDWEFGIKSRFQAGDVEGHANIALFRGKYKDIQRLLRITFISGGIPFPANRILNAASATVKGLEFDGSLEFSNAIKLSAAYTYLDASYDSYIVNNNGVIQDYTGAQFSGSPRHSASVALRTRLPLAAEPTKIYFQIDGSLQSRTYTEDTTNFNPATQMINPRTVLPRYGTANLHLDVEDIGGTTLNISAWVKNFTNEKYYTAGFDSYNALGYVVRLVGAPRTAGVTVRYAF